MALKEQVANIYSVGLQSVGSYQISGRPYLNADITVPGNLSAATEIQFESVSRAVTVQNTHPSQAMKLGFSANGLAGSNFVEIASGKEYKANIRVASVFLISSGSGTSRCSIQAELTNISANKLASNWSGSAGVG